MNVVITGVAGFVGSTLAERCLEFGWQVVGCDNFSPYYDAALKQDNLSGLRGRDGFRFVEGDIVDTITPETLGDVDVVFHQAGQPGVRASWDTGFGSYVDANITATQSLLEACKKAGSVRLVMASSSSVYGNAERYPVLESDETRPYSPYGVTKLAAERLAVAYSDNFGIPTVALRYFTVYGPRQRPDMAMHRLAKCALTGGAFGMFGDGSQIRDFTYVDDIVAANIASATAELDGPAVLNICGGSSVSLREVIDIVGAAAGRPVNVERRPAQSGDVARTGGDNSRAQNLLGWKASVSVEDGLKRQIAWMDGWLTRSSGSGH